ncbi:MAG TPA: hypothetical protein VGC09_08820 [Rhodopila sp.]
MRRFHLVVLLGLVAGCTNELAARQAQLAQWVGRPETDLVGLMGAPTRTYEAGGMKFLTYDDRRVEIVPGSPYFVPGPFGPGPFWYGGGGFPPTAMTLECNTTFTVAEGVVRAYSLRGNACG